MSLINDMLRNLEQRHAAGAPLPNEVRPLPTENPAVQWLPIVTALAVLVLAAAAAFLFLREPAQPAAVLAAAPPPPVVMPAPAPLPAATPLPLPVETAVAAVQSAVPSVVPPAEPAAAAPAPAPAAAKPQASPPVRAERPLPRDTLRLDTSLPSLDRVKPKGPPSPAPATAAAPADKAASSPPHPEIQAADDLRRARDTLAQGRRAEAEQLFKQGLAHLPAQTDAAMTLARLQVDRADLAAAWETLQRSLPHAQQQAAYRAFCGTVLQRMNRSREAVEHYQAALRLNPAEGRWWVGLGLALEGAGQGAEARDAFQRARAAGNLSPEMAAFAEQKSR